jgi:hypothetical protein
MNIEQIERILDEVTFDGYRFILKDENETIYLQAQYCEKDIAAKSMDYGRNILPQVFAKNLFEAARIQQTIPQEDIPNKDW